MIELARPWSQQPQWEAREPDAKWLNRELVFAESFSGGEANRVNNTLATSVSGAKLGFNRLGRARGFGATNGTATTDVVSFGAVPWVGPRTYICRYYRTGAGGNGIGRLFAQGTNLAYSNGVSAFEFYPQFTGGSENWRSSSFGTALNTWYVICIAHDASALNNTPKFYINGINRSISQWTASSGTPIDQSTTAISVGNSAALTRVFDGFISDFFIFNTILTPNEVAQLSEPSKLWAPRRIFVPVQVTSAAFPLLSNARMTSLTGTQGIPAVDYAF